MVPYTIFNYLLGLTDIKLRDFIPAGVGMLPGILVRLFIGSTLHALTRESVSLYNIVFDSEYSNLILFLIIGGGVVGISGIAYSIRVTKRYLKQLEDSVTPKDVKSAFERRKSLRKSQIINFEQRVQVELEQCANPYDVSNTSRRLL